MNGYWIVAIINVVILGALIYFDTRKDDEGSEAEASTENAFVTIVAFVFLAILDAVTLLIALINHFTAGGVFHK